ncbi:MAG TPA: phospho-N-acetylmuramoyl-pentapeptide-transferase [Phycisphaerae bacterium]|nr:phospho-N-acetylmuramoyl-pentapeptide-transferase [Phycisphaerae bacterium]
MIYLLYQGLILRMAGAAVVSFLIVLMLGPRMIRWLIRRKIGDSPEFDHADLNELTRHKSNTPTMGGVLIVVAMLVSIVLFANIRNMYVIVTLVALAWLGVLGGVDDWIKLRGEAGREGLKMWEKLVFQVALAVLLSIFTYNYGRESAVGDVNPAHSLYLPFGIPAIPLGMLSYAIIVVLTMVGSSNAVNLTDGMDGLAAGCVVIVALVFLLLAEIVGVRAWANFFDLPLVAGSAEMTVVCAAVIGSCLGFLWYNAHPAQVFMGDTGSLPLGGILGYIAVVTRQEVVLLIAGGVFVMEAGSVLLQVGCFKLTKPKGGLQGKRLFLCAPLHHHFHLGGWAEPKVVVRFWLLGIIFAALALSTLKLR